MMVLDLEMLNTFQLMKNGDTNKLIQDRLSNTLSSWFSFILLFQLKNRQIVKIINEAVNKIIIEFRCVNNVDFILELTLT